MKGEKKRERKKKTNYFMGSAVKKEHISYVVGVYYVVTGCVDEGDSVVENFRILVYLEGI